MNRLLDKLERWLRPYAVPNLTVGLVACQVLTYVFVNFLQPENEAALSNLILVPSEVFAGKWWLLFTFLAMPPITNVFFAFFYFYLFFLMGSALEQNWGHAKYNLFIFIGYVATVGCAMGTALIWPETAGIATTNVFLQGTVFLAFAVLYPDFQLLIMFLLPVKIKWLALFQWILYGFAFVTGGIMEKVIIGASVANYVVFFGQDIWLRMKSGQRRMRYQARQHARDHKPFHTCAVCGITDKSNPDAEFRYCSKCDGNLCYCMDHLKNHEHVVAQEQSAER